jgi:cation transport ATPase
MWSGRIADALAAATPVLHGESTMTVQALDLGLVVPISVVIAVAALARHPIGLAAAAAFAVTFVMMSAAIAAMMISSWMVTGVPAVEPIVVFTLASVAASILLSRMLASVNDSVSREAAARPRVVEPYLSSP